MMEYIDARGWRYRVMQGLDGSWKGRYRKPDAPGKPRRDNVGWRGMLSPYRRVKTDFSDGLCRLCNEPVVTGKKLCARHCAIAKKNLKKANAQQSNADHPWRHGNQLIFKKRDTQ